MLLDCAELKFQQVSDEPEESAVQIATDSQTTENSLEAEEASREEVEAAAQHVQEVRIFLLSTVLYG